MNIQLLKDYKLEELIQQNHQQKKTDWQEIEQLPGQDIKEKFQKKLGVEVDPALTFKKLEESLKYKI